AGLLLGIETVVDTSAAGFTSTPCYFAWKESVPQPSTGRDAVFAGAALQLSGFFTHLEELTPTSFKFRALALAALKPNPTIVALTTFRRRFRIPFYVCWLGCQSTSDTDQCLDPEVSKPCCS